MESTVRFEHLCNTLPEATITEWSADETLMQECRDIDVEVMDDYDVRQERGKFSFLKF